MWSDVDQMKIFERKMCAEKCHDIFFGYCFDSFSSFIEFLMVSKQERITGVSKMITDVVLTFG